MTLAQTAYDLQLASHGRFRLGLGTQIKPHIEKRFSMPWSQPVERMRELVLAIRAIWATWHEGAPLDFRGEFYRHTLMTPFFNPGPSPYGLPSIFLAGVGPQMTEMAGEVADGFIVHPFGTERSLRELTIPALERGAARAGRALADVEVAFPLMAIVADTDEQLARGRDAMRPRLAFYGSTPAYKVILDVHGWGDLQPELNRLSKTGDWGDDERARSPTRWSTRSPCRARPTTIGADRARALRRPRAAHLVRHQRPARPRPRRSRSSRAHHAG